VVGVEGAKGLVRWRTASPLFLDFIVRKPFANYALMQHRSSWLWWMASRAPQCWRRSMRHLCVSSDQDPTYNQVSKCVYAAKQEWLAVVGGLKGAKRAGSVAPSIIPSFLISRKHAHTHVLLVLHCRNGWRWWAASRAARAWCNGRAHFSDAPPTCSDFNHTLRVYGGLQEWLAVVGGLKGAKGLARWQEVRRAVALQLGDIEPGVQQAALKCMKVGVADKLPANRSTSS